MATEKKMSKEGEAYPMNGGDGAYSYSKNSSYQGGVSNAAKELVSKAIVENLDIKGTTIRVADLGCSVGPNTFFAVQNILDAIQLKHYQRQVPNSNSEFPEFQVFFNDHFSNDFNTLFLSLPSDRRYHAAGVPGSFHSRLFPSRSLHIVHVSTAIHWLSRVPKAVMDRSSPAWNKGRITYSSASDEVIGAFSDQYEHDMAMFLQARAEEIAEGGLMIIVFLVRPDGTPHSQACTNIAHDLLGTCLVDMVKKGIMIEEKVDTFNLPVYYVSPQEMAVIIERNGHFSIERMERVAPLFTNSRLTAKAFAFMLRSVLEGLIKAHFGEEIIDKLFDSYSKKLENEVPVHELVERLVNFCIVLKRKPTN